MIPPAEREKLVAGMVGTGMNSVRARLIVDLAARASERAFEALNTAVTAAPDFAASMAVREIALQLVSHAARHQVEELHNLFSGADIPRSATEIEL